MPVKEAKLLEGKALAAQIQNEIKKSIETFLAKGHPAPRLVSIQMAPDSGHEWYVSQQKKLADKLGIELIHVPPQDVKTETDLVNQIHQANRGPDIHGLFVTMPLPKNFDSDRILSEMNPQKDVEGIHPASLGLLMLRRAKLIPPTAYAALQLIEFAIAQSEGEVLKGKKAVIVGQSAIVGRPLQMLLGERRVTITVCNTGTSETDLEAFISKSDIVVACAGQPGLVKGAWIKPGAIVIDVGTTEVNGKLVGDVEFEEARKRAGFITPVPGGVGPLTVTMLMQNLMTAYKWQKGI